MSGSDEQNVPTIASFQAPNCVVCGGPGTVQHRDLADRLFGAPGRWSLRRCSNTQCRLGWLDPQPCRSEIWKLYQNYWTHDPGSSGVPESDAQLSSASRRIIKRAASMLLPWRRHALRSDSRYLAGRTAGRLLDVGCGSGAFLAGMAQLGWQATGVEFDEAAAAIAQKHHGVDVRVGGLIEQQFPDNSFDAITLSNVIEHLPEPLEVFVEMRRLLSPGGRLAMVTPNINSAGHEAFGRFWRGLEPPRHLFIYNSASLTALAQNAGLTVEACFSAAAGGSHILESSMELWHRKPRASRCPNARILRFREQISTMFNSDEGEFVVLLATK